MKCAESELQMEQIPNGPPIPTGKAPTFPAPPRMNLGLRQKSLFRTAGSQRCSGLISSEYVRKISTEEDTSLTLLGSYFGRKKDLLTVNTVGIHPNSGKYFANFI